MSTKISQLPPASPVPAGDEGIAMVQAGDTVQAPLNIARDLLKISPLEPIASRRATNWRAVTRRGADGRVMWTLILIVGQSEAIGALGLSVSDIPVDSANCFMFKLVDPVTDAYDPNMQSPYVASWKPVAEVVPLRERYDRGPNPPYADPVTGEAKTYGRLAGQTGSSTIAHYVNTVLENEGLTRQKFIFAVCAQGGQPMNYIADGTISHNQAEAVVQAFNDFCAAQDALGQIGVVSDHGQSDAFSLDNYAGEDGDADIDSLNYNIGPRVYANKIVRYVVSMTDMMKRINAQYDPWYFWVQPEVTFPSATIDFPVVNGRTSNTSSGVLLAAQMHDRIIVAGNNYPYQTTDDLHKTGEGTYNKYVPVAMAIYHTMFGEAKYRAPQVVGTRMLAPDRVRLICDTHDRELMIQEFGVYDTTLANGGTGFSASDFFVTTGLSQTQARFQVLTVDGNGKILTYRQVTNGSHPTDPTGNQATVIEFPTPQVVFGGANYINGVEVSAVIPSAIEAPRLRLNATGGVVTSVSVVSPGIFASSADLPTGEFTVTSGGFQPTPVRLQLPAVVGSGAIIAAKTRWQVCRRLDARPLVITQGTLTVVGAAAKGTIYTVQGGTLIPGATPAQFISGFVDGDGKPASFRMYRSGIYNVPPPTPIVAVASDTQSVTIATNGASNSCWPKHNDGFWGFFSTDDTMRGGTTTGGTNGGRFARVIGIAISSEYGITNRSIDLTFDAALGPNPVIHAGLYSQGTGSGTSAGTNVCTIPPRGWESGKFDQPSAEWLMRGSYPVHNPYEGTAFAPPAIRNALMEIGDDTPVTVSTAGLSPVPGFRVWGAFSGYTVTRVRGDRSRNALRIQRAPGNTGINPVSVAIPIYGEDAQRYIEQPDLFAAWFKTGADFSTSNKNVTLRVYLDPNAAPVFGTQFLPTSSVQFWTRNLTLTDTAIARLIRAGSYIGNPGVLNKIPTNMPSSDPPVPVKTIIVWMQAYFGQQAGMETAGANDWVQFELPQFDIGTTAKPFIYLSPEVEKARLGLLPGRADAPGSITANYTATADDQYRWLIAKTAGITITAPSPSTIPAGLRIKNESGGQCYLDPPSGVSIAGNTAGVGINIENNDVTVLIPRDATNYALGGPL